MVSNISILGSTGSIGTQALQVCDKHNIKVCALTANTNTALLEAQVRKYKPKLAVMTDIACAKELKLLLSDTDTKVLCGMEGLCEAASIDEAKITLNALVGMVGLKPTLSAINAGKNIALANKETLVAGGELVTKSVKENNVKLLPVDSEHSAIFQCLEGCYRKKDIKKLILTASGGPFFGKTYEELTDASPSDALKHPNWSMGQKITIDSATMMNKGLEIIEARWLFDVPYDMIDVVVHRESIIHSMIQYTDNSVIAQLGLPDMRIPIQYALTYPERYESPVSELDLADIAKLTFYKPDEATFRCMAVCKDALKKGGLAPAFANGANEVANLMYRQEKIKFHDIATLVQEAVNAAPKISAGTLQDVLDADKSARELVKKLVNNE
ncbi:MAG: 1-deoxy-D-xylulose-5-phosphate reductoisomerase [Clostridiales bacterium]|nr:1-deoxy-D-xylulose-5-phosphate reductoisomerase [Clostridiales bacterium]